MNFCEWGTKKKKLKTKTSLTRGCVFCRLGRVLICSASPQAGSDETIIVEAHIGSVNSIKYHSGRIFSCSTDGKKKNLNMKKKKEYAKREEKTKEKREGNKATKVYCSLAVDST